MAPNQGGWFDNLVNQIANASRRNNGGRYVPIEENPTWEATGMRRPPIRANVETGQLTLPLAERNIAGAVIQPSGLEAAGVATLPWERTVAGAAPTSATTANSLFRASLLQPTEVPGQVGLFPGTDVYGPAFRPPLNTLPPPPNLTGQAATNAATGTAGQSAAQRGLGRFLNPNITRPPARPLPPGVEAFQGTEGAGLGGRIGQGSRWFGPKVEAGTGMARLRGPNVFGPRTGVVNAGLGTAIGMIPELGGFSRETPANRMVNEFLHGTGGGTAIGGPMLGVLAGLGQAQQQGAFDIGRWMKENKRESPISTGLAKGALEGSATLQGPLGIPIQIASNLGEFLPEDWGNQISDVPTKVIETVGSHLPFGIGEGVTKFFGALGGGGGEGEQQQQEAPQIDPKVQGLIDAGFGADEADVTRRSTTYNGLLEAGIDQDIAFDVAYGDSAIGQKVTAARNQGTGSLASDAAYLQAATQPYLDQMNASANNWASQIAGSPTLAAQAPAMESLMRGNASALGAFANAYPFLNDLQRRGNIYDDWYRSFRLPSPTASASEGSGLTFEEMKALIEGKTQSKD